MEEKRPVIALIKDHTEAYLGLEYRLSDLLNAQVALHHFKTPMTMEQVNLIAGELPKIVLMCISKKEIRAAVREFDRLEFYMPATPQIIIACHPMQKLNRSSAFQLFKRVWLEKYKLWLDPADTSTVLTKNLGTLVARLLLGDKLPFLEQKELQLRQLYPSEVVRLERASQGEDNSLAELCRDEILRREKNPSMRSFGKHAYRR